MILSFHPCFNGDKNILCAGRDPNSDDISAIKQASAIILPQGCREALFHAASLGPAAVFPDYKARFTYKGKIGQIQLFEKFKAPHPKTIIFKNLNIYYKSKDKLSGFEFPFVFKFNWGGEGETVFLIKTKNDFSNIIEKASINERAGYSGFVIQKFIPGISRVLRVVKINKTVVSYWRVQKKETGFQTSLAMGAELDKDSDQDLQKRGILLTENLCDQSGINLAGFDLVFPPSSNAQCLFLEINYFFGRKGLGGSENYYELLNKEIKKWICDQKTIKTL